MVIIYNHSYNMLWAIYRWNLPRFFFGNLLTRLYGFYARDQVPSGGGIVIQGPLGFEFPNPCQPEAGRRKMKETDGGISLRKNERI